MLPISSYWLYFIDVCFSSFIYSVNIYNLYLSRHFKGGVPHGSFNILFLKRQFLLGAFVYNNLGIRTKQKQVLFLFPSDSVASLCCWFLGTALWHYLIFFL